MIATMYPKSRSRFAVLFVTSCHILHYKNAQCASPGTPPLFVIAIH